MRASDPLQYIIYWYLILNLHQIKIPRCYYVQTWKFDHSTLSYSGAKAASLDNGSRLAQGPIAETGESRARGAWGSRPLSAGPFHRPSLPEVEVARVLADGQLRPTDPAVPLIASIKKQLGRFAYEWTASDEAFSDTSRWLMYNVTVFQKRLMIEVCMIGEFG